MRMKLTYLFAGFLHTKHIFEVKFCIRITIVREIFSPEEGILILLFPVIALSNLSLKELVILKFERSVKKLSLVPCVS